MLSKSARMKLAQKIRYGFLLALAVLLCGGLVTLYGTTRWVSTSRAMRHSDEVIRRLTGVRALESGQPPISRRLDDLALGRQLLCVWTAGSG